MYMMNMKKSIIALALLLPFVSAMADSSHVVVDSANQAAPVKVLKSTSNGLLVMNAVNGTKATFDLNTNAHPQIGDAAKINVGTDSKNYCQLAFTYWSPAGDPSNAYIMFNSSTSTCYGNMYFTASSGNDNSISVTLSNLY